MQVQVLGLGASGVAAANLLLEQQHDVVVCDGNCNEGLEKRKHLLEASGATVILGQPLTVLPECQLVVVSPGIDWNLPTLSAARGAGIEMIGEAELAWRALKDSPWVGITGTNGKTTTTALTGAIFQAAGLNAPTCGNIGFPLCQVALDALTSGHAPDWVIAELSSYQVEASSTLSPTIGLWTTLTPDHLSRHTTVTNYANIKASLVKRAKTAVLNGDDEYLRQRRSQFPEGLWTQCSAPEPDAPPSQVYITEHNGEDWAWVEAEPVMPLSECQLLGEHNRQNLLMAIATAHTAGIKVSTIRKAVGDFPGLPHRLQPICTVEGVRFINDSKATNYDAALVGLASVSGPTILIAGGKPKAGDDTAWLASIEKQVGYTILVGEAAPQFAARLKDVQYTGFDVVDGLEQAVPLAFQQARQWLVSGMADGRPSATNSGSSEVVTVLFSPACASFDAYRNFEHRGEHFQECCERLAKSMVNE